MHNMIDLGMKESDSPCPAPSGKGKNKVHYPTLYVNSDKDLDLPDGTFYFTAKGRKVSSTESERDGEKPRYSCEIEVQSLRTEGKAEDETEDMDTGMVSMADAFKKSFKEAASKKKTKAKDEDEEY